MGKKDYQEVIEQGERLSIELMKTIFSEGDHVSSSVVIYALGKIMACVLADIKEQTGNENFENEFLEFFKLTTTNYLNNPTILKTLKTQKEIAIKMAERERGKADLEKKIADNKKECDDIKQKIAANEVLIAQFRKELKKFKNGKSSKHDDDSIVN